MASFVFSKNEKMNDLFESVCWFVGDCIGESSRVYVNEHALNTIIALNVYYNWRRNYLLLTLLRGSGGVERGNGFIKVESEEQNPFTIAHALLHLPSQ